MDAITVAQEAAHRAGDLLLRQFRQPQAIRKKGLKDLVTQADLDAENLIVGTIRQAFPEHEFLGEEGHTAREGADHVWVIDPLDGTRNYAQGIPFFCVSIALTVKGKTVLGVIFDPLHGETFAAESGSGAYVNGQGIAFAKKVRLEEAVVYAGFPPAQSHSDPGIASHILARLYPTVAVMRNMGSAALSLAYVACGRVDIAYHDRLSVWDMLAGVLLIEEAGGMATDFGGQPISMASHNLVAANTPSFHAPVLRTIQEVLAGHPTRPG